MPEVVALDGCPEPCIHPETVERARSAALPDPVLASLSGTFKLMGDSTRVRLLYALLEAGELCVCDLAAATSTAETTVSQALRLLRTAGVVAGRREGRMVYYRLADAHVRMLLDLSREHALHHRDRPVGR